MRKQEREVDYARKHQRVGWWALVAFLVLGFVLEALHGLKVSWYLDAGMQPRRLMWTLAHAHGTLISLIHIAFALTLRAEACALPWVRRASLCLVSSSILLPGGFFLGGVSVHGGDPNPAVIIVPIAALVLIAGVVFAALALRVSTRDDDPRHAGKRGGPGPARRRGASGSSCGSRG